ncbi:hypothetical protein Tco_0425384 [Tanacetum coccineum]
MESPGFAWYWSESEKMIPGKGDLHDYWRGYFDRWRFFGTSPFLHFDQRSGVETLPSDDGTQYCWEEFAAGRKSGAHISGGQFVARLAGHFGLLTAEILGGLTVITPELTIIDMAELVRLKIYVQLDDTWAWVAIGPERQPDAAAGAPEVAQDVSIVDKGGQADPAPVHAPPPPPAPVRTMPQRMARLEEDVHKIRGVLTDQREVIDAMAHDFSRFSTWVTTGLGRMMDRAGVTYVPYAQTRVSYQRRVNRGPVRPTPPQHSRTHRSQTQDYSYPYLLIKPGSKFSTIVHEYGTIQDIHTKCKNGISHAYQKLKGFYKGVLNLGPDYIRNAKTD